MVHNLEILLRLRNGQYLTEVFAQIKQVAKGRKTLVVVECAGNPVATIEALSKQIKRFATSRLEFVPVWEGGDFLLSGDVVMHWLDEMIYTPEALREMKHYLNDLDYDIIQARRLFCWDSPEEHNTAFPESYSTLLLSKSKKLPVRVFRLANPVLDFSFLTPDDRTYHSLGSNSMIRKILAKEEELVKVPHGN